MSAIGTITCTFPETSQRRLISADNEFSVCVPNLLEVICEGLSQLNTGELWSCPRAWPFQTSRMLSRRKAAAFVNPIIA